jgi:aspartokinase-like uncharacterized kinase
LRQIEPKCAGTRLPANWSVTSDAIAARLAIVLAADDLVLLKSIVPPAARSGTMVDWIAELAALGYVDGSLPMLAAGLSTLRFAVLPQLEPGISQNSM